MEITKAIKLFMYNPRQLIGKPHSCQFKIYTPDCQKLRRAFGENAYIMQQFQAVDLEFGGELHERCKNCVAIAHLGLLN